MVEVVGRLPRPIWQEAPLSFRIKVAESLDRWSQSQLRLVSKSDKDIVDRCPKFFAKVNFCASEFTMGNSAYCTISLESGTENTSHYFKSWSEATNRFLRVCGNPVHTIEVLFIRLNDIPRLLEELQGRLVTQIKVEHLQLKKKKSENVDLNGSFFEFMNMIRPGATFKFICEPIPFEQLNRFSEMEQWKRSKGLDLLTDHDLPSLNGYYHFNSLRLNIQKMSAHDAKKLIQAFIHKPAKSYKHYSTFFRIFTKEFVDPAAILSRYDDELKPMVTDPIENYYDQIRVQTFPMANSDYVLLVKAAGRFFAGSVCRENQIEQDYWRPPEL